jgi:hypothetical protein
MEHGFHGNIHLEFVQVHNFMIFALETTETSSLLPFIRRENLPSILVAFIVRDISPNRNPLMFIKIAGHEQSGTEDTGSKVCCSPRNHALRPEFFLL